EQITQMFSVNALLPAALHPCVGGKAQCRLVEHHRHTLAPRLGQFAHVNRHTLLDKTEIDGVSVEHLAGVHPQLVDCGLHLGVALLRPVAQANDPVAAAFHVIARFLARLDGDIRDAPIARSGKASEHEIVPDIEIELARHRVRVITVRALDKQEIAVFARVATECELILGAAAALVACFHLAGTGKPQPRLSEKIQTDIGERDVFLQHGTMTHPFAKALSEYEIGISEPKQIYEEIVNAAHLKCASLLRASEKKS